MTDSGLKLILGTKVDCEEMGNKVILTRERRREKGRGCELQLAIQDFHYVAREGEIDGSDLVGLVDSVIPPLYPL